MAKTEVVVRKLTAIELGREFPFFFSRVPFPVPPISTNDPEEIRVFEVAMIDRREAVVFTGVLKYAQEDDREICTPFVVIDFVAPREEDKNLKAVIRLGGVEYTAQQNLKWQFLHARSKDSPRFTHFVSNNGARLSFRPPIETEGLTHAMSLKLETSSQDPL